MISKVLVANRGEIAIRAFRAAYEMGIATVAVYPYEDRNSLHRLKADESYQIGETGHPVRAYLSVDEIIRVAQHAGADAVYPGYGFLSENPDLAAACAAAGITFVGPDAEVLELAGNKSRAIAAARAAGLPVLNSSAPSSSADELMAAAATMEFPLFVKAVSGGGGRGMRRVADLAGLPEAIEAASREAESAFGDPTLYLEQAVLSPRHIEVQILADIHGSVMHLFERDCSVQRRHQKVIELAPAPNLPDELRQKICADAVAFARQINYTYAGTVEFLLDQRGNYVFIEMNPRIQVEHTVTEEITDVDLVASQMRIADGETLDDLGLSQDSLQVHGAALQCRITTEDPANGFRPDTGRITGYRTPGGAGIRLDGGSHLGAEISPHFDSMLVKLTCRGRDFGAAVARARRALAEFRIRGVSTNIPFLQAVVNDPDFRAGRVTTSFIDERPYLLTARTPADRGTKILNYLADVTVNQPHGPRTSTVYPQDKLPRIDLEAAPQPGSKQLLTEVGPEGFARWLRESRSVAVTDTTFRDAHQSLLATRVRTTGLLMVAPYVARMTPQLLSIECWGGATYDVALRFLKEDPWERLAALREAVPNICLQMLLRGRNTVGYTPYPESVTYAFVQEATATGIDIYRIFDALNNVESMRPAIDAVRETGTAVAEVAMSYTGDVSDPNENLYTLDYYLKLAEQIVDAGAHVLAIKDMAGLLRPQAAHRLISALRSRFDLPVHVHTHDTPGGQLATYVAAWQAGADAVDGAAAPLAGTTSQPALSSIVAAAAHTEYDTGLSLSAVCDLEPYWEALRKVYAPFESAAACADGSGVSPRNPRRSVVQPAPASDRARSRRPVRGDRGELRGGGPGAGPAGEGHSVEQGGGRPRAGLGRGGRQRRRIRFGSSEIRHSRFGDRLLARRARRPAGGLAGTVAHQGARRTPTGQAAAGTQPGGRDGAGAGGPEAAGRAKPSAVPCSHKGIRLTSGTVRRHLQPVGQPVPVRAAARRRAPGQAGARRRAADRAGSDLRTRRARHAHGDVHPQRAAAAGCRA